MTQDQIKAVIAKALDQAFREDDELPDCAKVVLKALAANGLWIVTTSFIDAMQNIRDHDSREINTNNYGHDDVCALNAANVEIYEIANDALAQLEGAGS